MAMVPTKPLHCDKEIRPMKEMHLREVFWPIDGPGEKIEIPSSLNMLREESQEITRSRDSTLPVTATESSPHEQI